MGIRKFANFRMRSNLKTIEIGNNHLWRVLVSIVLFCLTFEMGYGENYNTEYQGLCYNCYEHDNSSYSSSTWSYVTHLYYHGKASVTGVSKNGTARTHISIVSNVTIYGEEYGLQAQYHYQNLYNCTVTSIESEAFKGDTVVQSVYIPSSIKSIGVNAFYGCNCLQQVNYTPAYLSSFVSSPFCESPIRDFIFSDNVKEIPSHLCDNLGQLNNVTIGKAVNTIGDFAFANAA